MPPSKLAPWWRLVRLTWQSCCENARCTAVGPSAREPYPGEPVSGRRTWGPLLGGPSFYPPRSHPLTRELRHLKRFLGRSAGTLRVCATCSQGHPEAQAGWEGGYCCGTDTARVFTAAEVAALTWAHGFPWHLIPPRGALQGCLFRTAQGCVLPPRARPAVCVSYFCQSAQRELYQRGRSAAVEVLVQRLTRTWIRFERSRRCTSGL